MRAACLSIALALCAAVVPVSAQAIAQRYDLNIPRQPLETAIKDFAHQTGLQVARFSDSIDGNVLVGPLSGDYSAEQALQQLLQPGGLAYKVVNENTIAIVDRDDKAGRGSSKARGRLRSYNDDRGPFGNARLQLAQSMGATGGSGGQLPVRWRSARSKKSSSRRRSGRNG